MFIKYIDMVIPAPQVEFKQVAFITFQIILENFQSSDFILSLKRWLFT